MDIVKKHIPMRMCAGCRKMAEKPSLIRVVFQNGQLAVDDRQKIQSRGVYLCKSRECIAKAQKRKVFSGLLKAKVPDEFYEELDKRAGE